MPDPNPRLAQSLAKFSGHLGLGLGPLQHAVLMALWERSPATVRDVHRRLRTKAYRTVVSALDRLYKKGLVRRERANRFNAYEPTMSRQELETAIVGSIVGPKV